MTTKLFRDTSFETDEMALEDVLLTIDENGIDTLIGGSSNIGQSNVIKLTGEMN